jgi:uncharacterized GH25 family protein
MRRAVWTVLILALPAAAAAHDTWIRPANAPVSPGAIARLEVTSGDAFPALDSPIDPARVARADFRLGGKMEALGDRRRRPHALELRMKPERPGVAVVAVVLKSRQLTLEPALIAQYLEEIGATQTAGPIWEKIPNPRVWRETYTKHAKTCVRVGEGEDESWRQPAGLALEIVPERDPTRLSAGDSLPVRVLKGGAPLPNFSVGAESGQGRKRRLRTDAEGRAVLVLDARGPWLVNGTDLRRAADGASWESDFTTLTLEVGPRR